MKRSMGPERVLAVGFLVLIGLGTALLALPAATVSGQSIGLFDALFTATSAVCVTGLVAVDTGTVFSLLGQMVLLLLIQLGGLGFMIFATLIMGALGKRISLSGRVVLRESMSASSLAGLTQLTRVYGLLALLVEGLGAALLAVHFVPMLGWSKGLWYSVFHAVSAFCNAGFDLLGGFRSLTGFRQDPLVLMTISGLILLGATGFPVIFELLRHRLHWEKLSLHARVALVTSGLLLLAGTAGFALTEWRNPATLGAADMHAGHRLLNAFFQSVTMRTAGFNSVDLAQMGEGAKLISVMLMFVGASPASTGGGVKTTTVAVIWLIMLSVIRGHKDVNVMGRRLPTELMRRSLALLMIYLLLLLAAVLTLTVLEAGRFSAIDMTFEATSALATVGVSAVGSPNLRPVSRAVLIPVMFLGRVGPLTLASALARRQQDVQNRIRYPEENLMIG